MVLKLIWHIYGSIASYGTLQEVEVSLNKTEDRICQGQDYRLHDLENAKKRDLSTRILKC